MGKYQPFHDLPAAQFEALVRDIAERGVLLPIIVDEDDKTIDGHQRRKAAAEAGVECPRVVVDGLSEDEKKQLAITLNLFRRHLSGTERSKALADLANLGLSTRRMADLLGMSKSTVHRDLTELSQTGQLENRPDRVEGADGKSRPASMPPRDIDPDTGEIVDDQATDTPESPTTGGGDASAPDDEPASLPPTPPVDPTLGYRARSTAERSKVRDGLLTLDADRVIETTDDPKAWLDFISDARGWLDKLEAAAAGPRLKAVQ